MQNRQVDPQQTDASSDSDPAQLDMTQRKAFIQFSEKDARILLELQPVIEPHIPRLTELFYQSINQHRELMGIVDDAGSSISRLKQTMQGYLTSLFCGRYDDQYFKGRCRIGQVHNAIGLSPRWYLGAYTLYSSEFSRIIAKKYRFSPTRMHQAMDAIYKILNLDTQLIMDTYIANFAGQLEETNRDMEARVAVYGQFIQKVADGDLTSRLDRIEGADGLSALGQSLNTMVTNLARMVGQTREASRQLQANVGDAQNAITSQSNGIAQQATALNETTSTMSEIRATSAQTLEMAQNLGQIAERTQEESEQGKKAVEDTVTGMEAIREKVEGIAHTILSLSEQTQQIGEITDVVNGLAQQLKMLALNASIEAAKAGEAGKGFGVVATEVKELAEQSQQSTAQVQKILEDIRHATDRAVMATEEGSKGVDIGVELVNKTGQTMHNLSDVIHEASSASQQIVMAVRQEVTGIDQINTAITEINAVTSQFVASSDQTKNVANGLAKLAQELSSNVSLFKI